MQDVFNKLNTAIERLGIRSFFNKPVSKKEIINLENVVSLKLPDELKQFYSMHNGGFFADTSWTQKELKSKNQFEYIQWNSNHFLTIEAIKEAYYNVETILEAWNSTEKYLPFFQTKEQKQMVINLSNNKVATSVLKIVRQASPECWIMFSDDFNEFLQTYIDKEGDMISY